MSFHMYVPTRVLFGAGQLNNLNTQAMPGTKAMIVISMVNQLRKMATLQDVRRN